MYSITPKTKSKTPLASKRSLGFSVLMVLLMAFAGTSCTGQEKPAEKGIKVEGNTFKMPNGKSITIKPGTVHSLEMTEGKVSLGKDVYNFTQLSKKFWSSKSVVDLGRNPVIHLEKKGKGFVLRYGPAKSERLQELELKSLKSYALGTNPGGTIAFMYISMPCLNPTDLIELMGEEGIDEVILQVEEEEEARYAEAQVDGVGTVILDSDTFKVIDPTPTQGDVADVIAITRWTKICDIDLTGKSALICTPCLWIGNDTDGWCCIPFSSTMLKVVYDEASNTISIYKQLSYLGKIDCCPEESDGGGR